MNAMPTGYARTAPRMPRISKHVFDSLAKCAGHGDASQPHIGFGETAKLLRLGSTVTLLEDPAPVLWSLESARACVAPMASLAAAITLGFTLHPVFSRPIPGFRPNPLPAGTAED